MEDTPIQTFTQPRRAGIGLVLPRPVRVRPGRAGRFDYAHLICFLDQAWEADGRGTRPFAGDRLRPVPFLLQHTGQRVGVFATRAPVRPNYLALTRVRVLAVRGNEADFAGVDLLDGTPVLDIKPFEPQLTFPAIAGGAAGSTTSAAAGTSSPPPPLNPRPPWPRGPRGRRPAPATRLVHRPRRGPTQGGPTKLSARNQLSGTVRSVELGAVMAEVTVDVNGQEIVSAITRAWPSGSASPRASP